MAASNLVCWYKTNKITVSAQDYAYEASAKQVLTLPCPPNGGPLRLKLAILRPLQINILGPLDCIPRLVGVTWENLAIYKSAHADEPGWTCPIVCACQCHETPCKREYSSVVDTHIRLVDWDSILQAEREGLVTSENLRFPKIFTILADMGVLPPGEDSISVERYPNDGASANGSS